MNNALSITQCRCIIVALFLSVCPRGEAQTAVEHRAFGQNFFSGHISESFSSSEAGNAMHVEVMGEVAAPGNYILPAGSRLPRLLSLAGGTTDVGSLRLIQHWRKGRLLHTVDLYPFLLSGKQDSTLLLADGDAIIVPPFACRVLVGEGVKRPMFYETLPHETVADVLRFAEGRKSGLYDEQVRLVRYTRNGKQIHLLNDSLCCSFLTANGDSVSLVRIPPRWYNKVEVHGAVMRPGIYPSDGNDSTVLQLLHAAGGLRDDAFLGRVLLYRQQANGDFAVLPLDISAMMEGRSENIKLFREDILHVPFRQDVRAERSVSVFGEVRHAGSCSFAENMTVKDVILLAGGTTDAAYGGHAEVVRRSADCSARFAPADGIKIFSVSLETGCALGADTAFLLQPFDEVFVRREPLNVPTKHVEISGEVLFPGVYALPCKDWRLSDLLKAAGGLLPSACVEGIRLERLISAKEKRVVERYFRQAKVEVELGNSKNVSVNIAEALVNPHRSSHDLLLENGDRLYVPVAKHTVSVYGAVVAPRDIVWKSGKSLEDYVGQVGGYTYDARKKCAIAIQMNGEVTRIRRSSDIRAGAIVFIPSRTSAPFVERFLKGDEQLKELLPMSLFIFLQMPKEFQH